VFELTVDLHGNGVLPQVGGGHHHAGEDPLVLQGPPADQEAEVGRDGHPVGVVTARLHRGLRLVGLLQQQVPRGPIFTLLERERETPETQGERESQGERQRQRKRET